MQKARLKTAADEETPEPKARLDVWKTKFPKLSDDANKFVEKSSKALKHFLGNEEFRKHTFKEAKKALSRKNKKLTNKLIGMAQDEAEFKFAAHGVKNVMAGKRMTKKQKKAFNEIMEHMTLEAGETALAETGPLRKYDQFTKQLAADLSVKSMERVLDDLKKVEDEHILADEAMARVAVMSTSKEMDKLMDKDIKKALEKMEPVSKTASVVQRYLSASSELEQEAQDALDYAITQGAKDVGLSLLNRISVGKVRPKFKSKETEEDVYEDDVDGELHSTSTELTFPSQLLYPFKRLISFADLEMWFNQEAPGEPEAPSLYDLLKDRRTVRELLDHVIDTLTETIRFSPTAEKAQSKVEDALAKATELDYTTTAYGEEGEREVEGIVPKAGIYVTEPEVDLRKPVMKPNGIEVTGVITYISMNKTLFPWDRDYDKFF